MDDYVKVIGVLVAVFFIFHLMSCKKDSYEYYSDNNKDGHNRAEYGHIYDNDMEAVNRTDPTHQVAISTDATKNLGKSPNCVDDQVGSYTQSVSECATDCNPYYNMENDDSQRARSADDHYYDKKEDCNVDPYAVDDTDKYLNDGLECGEKYDDTDAYMVLGPKDLLVKKGRKHKKCYKDMCALDCVDTKDYFESDQSYFKKAQYAVGSDMVCRSRRQRYNLLREPPRVRVNPNVMFHLPDGPNNNLYYPSGGCLVGI